METTDIEDSSPHTSSMTFSDSDNVTAYVEDMVAMVTMNQSVSLFTFSVCQRVILGLGMMIILAISVPGNFVICFIVYRNSFMRSAINILLATMATSDVLLTLVCLPLDMLTLMTSQWVLGGTVCKVHAVLYSLFLIESVTVLLIISVDRYLIIVHKREKLSIYHAKLLILTSWIYSMTVSFFPVVGWSEFEVKPRQSFTHCELAPASTTSDEVYLFLHFNILFLLPFLLMSLAYLFILNSVRHNSIRIHTQPGPLYMYTNRGGNIKRYSISTLSSPYLTPDMRFKTRTFTTILILFVIFFMCRGPYAVALFSWNYRRNMSKAAYPYLLWWCYMNQALNPVIYASRIKKFREIFRNFWIGLCHYLPGLPRRARRRINPGVIYEVPEGEKHSHHTQAN